MWSLGVILYTMLVGRWVGIAKKKPFKDQDGGQLEQEKREFTVIGSTANGKSHERLLLLLPIQQRICFRFGLPIHACAYVIIERYLFTFKPSTRLGKNKHLSVLKSFSEFFLSMFVECAGEKGPNADGEEFFMNARCSRVERIWKQDYFQFFFVSIRWDGFNVHLPSVFWALSIDRRTKRNSNSKGEWDERARERMEILCQQTAGEKQNVASRRLCLHFFKPSKAASRVANSEMSGIGQIKSNRRESGVEMI